MNNYIVSFISYTGHGSLDVVFDTKEAAEREYRRAITVRDEWLTNHAGLKDDALMIVIPFDTIADNGFAHSINLINYEVSLRDMEGIVLAQIRADDVKKAEELDGIH